MDTERGFFLPIVVGVSTVAFMVCLVFIQKLHTFQYAEKMEWEQMKARHAALSGIELMKYRLTQNPSDRSSFTQTVDQMPVTVKIIRTQEKKVQIQATAYAKIGVRQTISVNWEIKQNEKKE